MKVRMRDGSADPYGADAQDMCCPRGLTLGRRHGYSRRKPVTIWASVRLAMKPYSIDIGLPLRACHENQWSDKG